MNLKTKLKLFFLMDCSENTAIFFWRYFNCLNSLVGEL